MNSSSDGEFGYNTGTTVRILWFDVYDNVEFVPVELSLLQLYGLKKE